MEKRKSSYDSKPTEYLGYEEDNENSSNKR